MWLTNDAEPETVKHWLYKINPEACKGCSKCARNCPVGAITGEIRKPFVIDTAKCIKCGACIDNCAFHAVYTEN